jgi:large repetitive protein
MRAVKFISNKMRKRLIRESQRWLLSVGVLVLGGCSSQPSASSQNPRGPQIVSISPASGSGFSHVFEATYSHPDGSSQITVARVLFNQYVDGRKACYIYYDRAASSLLLVNDSGDSTNRIPIGGPGRVGNSQCELDAGASSVVDDGKNLILKVAVAFKTTFSRNRNAYLYAEDSLGKSTGFHQRGTWTVP